MKRRTKSQTLMVRMMDTYLKGIGYHLAFDEWIKRNYEVRTYHRNDWDTTPAEEGEHV